jgi:hypothetical protein
MQKGMIQMSVKIGHASIDERGKASGGQAGDQTGREVFTRTWYNKPWLKVIRPKSSTHAEKIAKAMEQACANNNIGYDQYQRTTLFSAAQKVKFDLSKVKTKVETDCSALVAVCVNAAGIPVSKDIYTGNEATALSNTGKFTILTDSKYLTSDKNLKRGDILLGSGHTAIVLSNGENIKGDAQKAKQGGSASSQKASSRRLQAAMEKSNSVVGIYRVTASSLNLRIEAGTQGGEDTILTSIKKGETVHCYGYYNVVKKVKWLLVQYMNFQGYVSTEYLEKA